MTHHIHDRDSTEAQFFDAYDKMKSDLAGERQKNMLLADQLREANGENRDLSYKVDFLTSGASNPIAWRRVRDDGVVTFWEKEAPDAQPLYAIAPPSPRPRREADKIIQGSPQPTAEPQEKPDAP